MGDRFIGFEPRMIWAVGDNISEVVVYALGVFLCSMDHIAPKWVSIYAQC